MTDRPDQRHEPREKIVVGVDGSASSRNALHWASRQACLSSGELHVVISAWDVAAPGRGDAADGDPPAPGDLRAVQKAAAILDDQVNELVDRDAIAAVHRHVAIGHLIRAILDVAADADLLVSGSEDAEHPAGTSPGEADRASLLASLRCPLVIVHGPDGLAGAETWPRASAGR